MANQYALVWTPAAQEAFARLHAREMSFGRIAEELQRLGFNITRNACIGKARRMKIKNGRVPGRNMGDRKTPQQPKPKPKLVEPPPEPVIVNTHRSGLLIDLEPDQCRYPTGDRAPYLFCVADKAPHSNSYCARHHHLCHQPARMQ